MTSITTHVLDTSIGKPAAEILVQLFRIDGDQPILIGASATDQDGRAQEIGTEWELLRGRYRLHFEVASYFSAQGKKTFYPDISIDFIIDDVHCHYHIPLLLSPFGYSTYRGS
ncbi:MAG TPA: hydroxyisourate hydrolase [Planctomycetaceae bacterium]|nr:hydroxyisourate hydrolase [Planctomycetaceae bacterium]